MITPARPLRIKQILTGNGRAQDNAKTPWCGKDNEEVLMHRSWVSIATIIELSRKQNNRKPVIYLPFLFCNETIVQFEKDVEIVYYDINEDYSPCIQSIKAESKNIKPDIIVVVHYFGRVYDTNDIRMFCDNNTCLLVDDATHVLYPKETYKFRGDFIIFSPWKSLGIPDGAVLVINNDIFGNAKDITKYEIERILSTYREYSKRRVSIWKLKKLIQKLIPNSAIKYKSEVERVEYSIEEKYQISDYSKQFLLTIKLQDLELLGDIKGINYEVISDYLVKKYGVVVKSNNKACVPYGLFIESKDSVEKEQIRKDLLKLGKVANSWPDVRKDIKECPEYAKRSDNHLLIAIHDGIKLNRWVPHTCSDIEKEPDISAEVRVISLSEYESYLLRVSSVIPFLQAQAYTSAKKDVSNWKKKHCCVLVNGEVAAVYTELSKYGIVYRINKGPIFVRPEYTDEVIGIIRKRYRYKGILFWAPNLLFEGEMLQLMIRRGFRYCSNHQTTGFLDLYKNEPELMSDMTTKWRNQLKKALKSEVKIEQVKDYDEFVTLLKLHAEDKEKRKYSDSGDGITDYLFKTGALKVYASYSAEEVLAFVFIAEYYNTATYYIGWSSEEGYKLNMNRLLLWHAILQSKTNGCRWFDLGGIDLIYTKGVAEFKLGLGCEVYKYVGEYIGV